ncbi:MAG: ABC transporter ATP-binding protein/permease [Nitrospirota bacterium]|nr:ABC transporter ATP-binding protein/permease [Nitrospirota bacterium]
MNQESSRSFFDPAAWRYFIEFYRGQHKRLALSAVISAAQSLFIVPTLLLVRYVFDVAIPQQNIRLLVLIGIGIFVFRLINSAVSLWIRSRNISTIKTAIFNLREDLLNRIYRFSRAAHTRLDQKTTHARIVQDTERLSNMSDALISRLIPSLFTSLALCVILLFLNWFLFLIMISLFPALYIANRYTGKLVKKNVYACQRSFEKFSKGVLFILRHIDLTRIQTAEEQEISRQTGILEDLKTTSGKMIFIYAVHGNAQSILTGLSGIIILVVGGITVANRSITLGEFISFYVAAGYLNGYVNTITTSVADIIAGNESIVTLHQLAATKNVQPYLGKKQIPFKGFLSFESVSFRYEDKPVLKDISLSLHPHSRVAIIGSNGAGKSTMTHLILGFYSPLAGRLYADDVPYEEVDVAHLRRQIGVVMQDPALFSGTILENISYGSLNIDREKVSHAAKLALADDFIRKLPEGYDTYIGEDGVLLSGGERQRLALTRALLRRPRLLILDEPTNHLDRAAVGQLLDNLDDLDDRPAILMISHDMSIVSSADEVYRLEEGRLEKYAFATSDRSRSE